MAACGAGLGGVGGEVRGHGVVEEQVALRHVLAEVALHYAGVDEVFERNRRSCKSSSCCKFSCVGDFPAAYGAHLR